MSLLISVVIPTYKRPVAIVMRAVESVLTQTLSPMEIIVVDDSPTDFTQSKALEYALAQRRTDIIYLKHKQNMGACAARNTGITNAKGEIIAFLDDDDEWLPDKLEKQIRYFKDKNCGLVYCDAYIILDDGTVRNINSQYKKYYNGFVYEKLIHFNFISSASLAIVRKSCFEDIGMFDNDFDACQDYDMWLRIAKKYTIEFVDEPLVNYYLHKNERISTNPRKRIQGMELLIKKHKALYLRHPLSLARRKLHIAGHYKTIGNYIKAISLYIKYGWARPFLLIKKILKK